MVKKPTKAVKPETPAPELDFDVAMITANLQATLKPVPSWEQPKAKPRPKVNWSQRITKCWNDGLKFMQKSAEAFIACGDNLIAAKSEMHPDDFTKMIREELPFKEHKAWELIHIAERPWIKTYTDKLPVHWTVLGMIAKLEEVEFLEKINDGTINPHMTAKDLLVGHAAAVADDSEDDADAEEDDSDDTRERVGRGKQGKGAGSKAVPQPPHPPEVMLAKDIIQAAFALYHASNDAVSLNVNGAVDRAIDSEISKSATPGASLNAILAGLRYATELADVIEDLFKSPAAAE